MVRRGVGSARASRRYRLCVQSSDNTNLCVTSAALGVKCNLRAYLPPICQVEASEGILHVPEVDESVAEVGNGSLAHCLVASQWGTPATAEYAVNLHCSIAHTQMHLGHCAERSQLTDATCARPVYGNFAQRKFSPGLCDGHLRMFLESWCRPLVRSIGYPPFVALGLSCKKPSV